MSKFIAWLKSLFIHSSEEKTEMTDQVVEVTPAATVATATTDTTATTSTVITSETDAVCEQLRKLVVAAGAQAHVVIDDLITLAKKIG